MGIVPEPVLKIEVGLCTRWNLEVKILIELDLDEGKNVEIYESNFLKTVSDILDT